LQTGNNSSNCDNAQIDKKDDADSTKTIAKRTSEHSRRTAPLTLPSSNLTDANIAIASSCNFFLGGIVRRGGRKSGSSGGGSTTP